MTTVEIETWGVIAEPINGNTMGTEDKKNEGGLIVYLVRGRDEKHEVGRAAYVRKYSTAPKKKFDTILQEFLNTAQQSADAMNELLNREQEIITQANETMRTVSEEAQRAVRTALSEAEEGVRKARDEYSSKVGDVRIAAQAEPKTLA